MYSYIGLWITFIYTLVGIAISVTYYFKFPQYHNIRTVLAIFALIVLALAGLLLLFVQTHSSTAARSDSLSLSIAIFSLTMVIFQSITLYPQWKRQGRGVLIVSFAIFAIVFVIYGVYGIYALVTAISH